MSASGTGYYTYEDAAWLKYGQNQMVTAFENLAITWNQSHPDHPIGVGDLGAKNGVGNFQRHPGGGHAGGLIIDLVPCVMTTYKVH